MTRAGKLRNRYFEIYIYRCLLTSAAHHASQTRRWIDGVAGGSGAAANVLDEVQPRLQRLGVGNREKLTERPATAVYRLRHRIRQRRE